MCVVKVTYMHDDIPTARTRFIKSQITLSEENTDYLFTSHSVYILNRYIGRVETRKEKSSYNRLLYTHLSPDLGYVYTNTSCMLYILSILLLLYLTNTMLYRITMSVYA